MKNKQHVKEENQEDFIKEEMLEFIKGIRKKCEYDLDKHICDHIVWTINDYYILENAILKTSFGKVIKKSFKKNHILI